MPIMPTNNNPMFDPGASADRTKLSKDDFMKIFLKEMMTQDPFKPNDSGQMLQEMSQLTALSANEDLKKTIDSLNINMGKTQAVNASQLIGKKVAVGSGISPLVAGEGLQGSVIVSQPVESVTITIKDSGGNVVKTINEPASDTGLLDFSWDGKDDLGNELKPDYYQISASGAYKGQQVAMQTAGFFKVNSVAFDKTSNNIILNLDGLGGINMDNIIKII
jgi:flagellar basal-body rod modification protein FlgD